MSQLLINLLVVCVVIVCGQQQDTTKFQVIFEWNYINFTWPSEEVYETAIKTAKYIPENNQISGVKYFDDYLYLSLPRMKDGVPVTLARIPLKLIRNDTAPLLEPYPSWGMNTEGECNSLQNVQNIEIDTKGLMWILDGGRTRTLTKNPGNKCPPRLIIYDTKLNQTTTIYVFPEEILKSGIFLYDLVVDDSDGGYAYITDNNGPDPGIIVYSLKKGKGWKVRDENSMKADPEAIDFTVNGTGVSAKINIAGIALGPKMLSQNNQNIPDRIVYYSPLSSYRLYSINSSVLQNENFANADISKFVTDLGRKASQTDGMVMDENGILFYGLLADHSIGRWDSKTAFPREQKVIARDRVYIQWPDSLAFDMSGNLLVVTNRLQKYIYGRLNLTEPNFRILQGYIGSKSYLYNGINSSLDVMLNEGTRSIFEVPITPKNDSTLYYEVHTMKNVEISTEDHKNDVKSSATIQETINLLWILFAFIVFHFK